MQVASSQFATAPLGCQFRLRAPLAKATARKCLECGQDVFAHAFSEVAPESLSKVLETCADDQPSEILPGKLLVGSWKAVLKLAQPYPDDETSVGSRTVVVNTAGTKLYEFLPRSREPFEKLRKCGRLVNVEWDDSDDFAIPRTDLLGSEDGSTEGMIKWMHAQIKAGNRVLINCAQGRSRSGAMAVAYLMASKKVHAAAALCLVQAERATVQPNPGFLRQLGEMQTAIHALQLEDM